MRKKTSPRVSRGKPNNRLKRCNFILFALFINFDSKLAANRVSNCEYKSGARQKKKQNNNKIPNIAKIFFVLVLIAMLKVYGVSFSLSRSAHTLVEMCHACRYKQRKCQHSLFTRFMHTTAHTTETIYLIQFQINQK